MYKPDIKVKILTDALDNEGVKLGDVYDVTYIDVDGDYVITSNGHEMYIFEGEFEVING